MCARDSPSSRHFCVENQDHGRDTDAHGRGTHEEQQGAVRSLRLAGRVPAVIYGDKKTPELISIDTKIVTGLYNKGTFMSQTLDVNVDGKIERVIPRDVQREVVRDFIIHVDFLRLGKNSTIHVDVPVHFINHEASPGLKAGGVLNIVRHEVQIICPADAIPAALEVDLSGFNLGDSVHISVVKFAANVRPVIADRDFTVATITAPASVVSAGASAADGGEASAEEGAEGEASEEADKA